MNWKQLKNFCNNLSESELEKNVMLWRESEAITNIEAEELGEDQFVDDEADWGDGCFPLSEAESFIKTCPEDYPDGLQSFTKVYDKGHPILTEIF